MNRFKNIFLLSDSQENLSWKYTCRYMCIMER